MYKYQDMYDRTLELGITKLANGSEDGNVVGPRIGTGGGFSGIFLWDTAFCIFWMRYHQDLFPCTVSLDNFYRLQQEDGCIHREYDAKGIPSWPDDHPITFAPPLLAWAELGVFEVNEDVDRLKRVYPHLKKHYHWCKANFQRPNGLYFGDSLGCGMDNLPRYPRDFEGSDDALKLDRSKMSPQYRESDVERWQGGDGKGSQWNRQGTFIDMSAQVAFNAMNLAEICRIIEHEDGALWEKEYESLKGAIHEKCWSEEYGFYFDLDEQDRHIVRFHIGGFWPLLAGVAPEECIDAVVGNLLDERKFNRVVPVPSLAADDADYLEGGEYWRGSSWPCTTYMVLKGLGRCGRHELAFELAQKYVDCVDKVYRETNTIWENHAPEAIVPGSMSGPDFCGWGGLGPVAVVREFLNDSFNSNLA